MSKSFGFNKITYVINEEAAQFGELYHYPDRPGVINANSSSDDYRERMLSNFSETPFRLAETNYPNVEAFVQSIKFPEGSTERWYIAQLSAREAKKFSLRPAPSHIEWEGKQMPFRSLDHYRLQAAAIFSKFAHNQEAGYALLQTGELPIIHDLGHPERPDTCLPPDVFSKILTEIRQHFLINMGADIDTHTPIYATEDVIRYSIGFSENLFSEDK